MINQVVDDLEGKDDSQGAVKEIVKSFILPHAQREIFSSMIDRENQRYLDAARVTLNKTMESVEGELSAHIGLGGSGSDKENGNGKN